MAKARLSAEDSGKAAHRKNFYVQQAKWRDGTEAAVGRDEAHGKLNHFEPNIPPRYGSAIDNAKFATMADGIKEAGCEGAAGF